MRCRSKDRRNQAIVSATASTARYGIDATSTRRQKPFIEEEMLCLNEPGTATIIAVNRTRTTKHSPVDEVDVELSPVEPATSMRFRRTQS